MIRSVYILVVLFAFSSKAGATVDALYEIERGRSMLVALKKDVSKVYISDEAILDAEAVSENQIVLWGRAIGEVELIWIADNGDATAARVKVKHPISAIEEMLVARFPDVALDVRAVSRTLILSGEVASEQLKQKVGEAVESHLGKGELLANELEVTRQRDVRLHVRFVSISRSLTEKLGISWNGLLDLPGVYGRLFTSDTLEPPYLDLRALGDFDINTVLRALDQQGLATILAEPSLVAHHEREAELLIGGEIPIPVPGGDDSGAFTISYKPFGISVSFLPVILEDSRIDLSMDAEVSDLGENLINLNGASVPAISSRRIKTSLVLTNGQSFAVGGLVRRVGSDGRTSLPGAFDLPIIGSIFDQRERKTEETELVIIVTAEFAKAQREPKPPEPVNLFRLKLEQQQSVFAQQTLRAVHPSVDFVF